jgi:hypothetical protein
LTTAPRRPKMHRMSGGLLPCYDVQARYEKAITPKEAPPPVRTLSQMSEAEREALARQYGAPVKPRDANLPAVRLRYPGKCASCGGALPAGEMALWDRGARKAYHPKCP